MFYNLVHLQCAIKKDPAAYREEFLEQFNRFGASLALFKQNPSDSRKDFQDLLLFVGHLASLFAKENEAVRATPATICELLRKHKTVIQSDVRTTFCRAIMLFRSRGLLTPIEVHTTFFDAFVIRDRELRKMLFDYLVNDVKTLNRAQKSAKVNAELRTFLRKVLQNETGTAARMALALLIALYRKGVWRDEAVVNMIAECCFSRCTKLLATALRFFLKAVADDDAAEKGDSQSDSEESEDDRFDRSEKQLRLGFRVGRKTSKREKRLDRRLRKLKNKRSRKGGDSQVDYGVLYSLNDPQTFCERLFRSLEACRERFRLRVAMMSFISRLIAVHKLIVLNFYPFVVRYLQPRQLFVTRILVYAAQACHEHVPPDSVQLLLNTICNNFITERNSSEAITVGINTVREICARCPYGISTELLNDLCAYKNWKKDRTVNSAARSLISLYRDLNPSLLDRRHRGKPTEAQAERIEELAKAAGFNDSHSNDKGDSGDDDDQEQSFTISKQPVPLLFGASSTLSHIPGSEALEAFQRGGGGQASTETADMDNDEQEEPWDVSEAESDDDQLADQSCEDEQEENESAASEGDSNNEQDSDDDENQSQIDSEENDNESDDEEGGNESEDGKKERPDKLSKVQNGPSKAKRRRVDSDTNTDAATAGPTQLNAAERARELLCSRILTDAEFETIRRVQANKEVTFTSSRKRKANDAGSEEEEDEDEAKNQFVRLSDIASVGHSSRAKLVGLDKRSRAASIKREKEEQRRDAVNPARKKGRRGREKPTTASRSNAEQRKSKPFMMVRPKLQRKRAKRSFRDKQSSFRKSLVKRMHRAK